MKSKSKSKSATPVRIDPYIDGLMSKLLDRLTSLEKKIDAMVTNVAAEPSEAKQLPRRDRTLYEAICADCHKVCEVPFKPSEDRAVYCKECFARRRSQPTGRQATANRAYPILTPVAMPPKPMSKPLIAQPMPKPIKGKAKKSKKKK